MPTPRTLGELSAEDVARLELVSPGRQAPTWPTLSRLEGPDAEGARDEAAAIVLLAKARMGELTRAVVAVPNDGSRSPSGRAGNHVPDRNVNTRTAKLEASGVSRKEAAECEKIADLKASGDLDRMIASGTGRTTTAALAPFSPRWLTLSTSTGRAR